MNISNITTTTPIVIINPNWFASFVSQISHYYIIFIIGTAMIVFVLVVSAIRKREKANTYRIIIIYQMIAALVEELSRILEQLLLADLLSATYVVYIYKNYPIDYHIVHDLFYCLISYSKVYVLFLLPLFSINRFLAVCYKHTFAKHMTTKLVHIYCIMLLAITILVCILNELSIYLTVSTSFINGLPIALALVVGTFAELTITPITSVWVIVELLSHIRMLNNANDKKGQLEYLFISFALLLQSIYTLIVRLPFVIILVFFTINQTYFYDYIAIHPEFTSIYYNISLFASYYDTPFFTFTLIVNVRVYAEVLWKIPLGIFRFIRKIVKKASSKVDVIRPATPPNVPTPVDNNDNRNN